MPISPGVLMRQTMKNKTSRKVVNGVWYEVCVSVAGEIRDVLIESNKHDAEKRTEQLANQWPDCELIFVRQHRKDPERGEGASIYCVLHKLTLDFRKSVETPV